MNSGEKVWWKRNVEKSVRGGGKGRGGWRDEYVGRGGKWKCKRDRYRIEKGYGKI